MSNIQGKKETTSNQVQNGTYLYVRCSSKSQDLIAQRESLLEWCASKGWGNNPTIYEEKVSATTMDRPQLERMLQDVVRHDCKRVLVWDISRLTRTGIGDCIATLDFLQKNGVDLFSRKEGISFTSDIGKMVAGVLSTLSKMENDIRGDKIRLGIAKKREVHGGKTPWLTGRGRNKVNDQKILDLKQAGLSVRKIASTINLSKNTVQNTVGYLRAVGALAGA